ARCGGPGGRAHLLLPRLRGVFLARDLGVQRLRTAVPRTRGDADHSRGLDPADHSRRARPPASRPALFARSVRLHAARPPLFAPLPRRAYLPSPPTRAALRPRPRRVAREPARPRELAVAVASRRTAQRLS